MRDHQIRYFRYIYDFVRRHPFLDFFEGLSDVDFLHFLVKVNFGLFKCIFIFYLFITININLFFFRKNWCFQKKKIHWRFFIWKLNNSFWEACFLFIIFEEFRFNKHFFGYFLHFWGNTRCGFFFNLFSADL